MRKENPGKTLLVITVLLAIFFGISAFPAAAAPVKIMCLGDSITGSPGCWRALLWRNMQNAGFTNVDFVGTLQPQGCGFTYDGENEGHGGILATNMADQNQLPPWLSQTSPDIIMMHLGTNDCWSARATSVILTAFSKLVDQMRANNPNMKILVAKIIPMNPTGGSACAECPQRVIDLNNALPAWAAGKTTAQSPITLVDQWTGFSTATDTYDGVHPNDAGNVKIADKWFPPLTALLVGATPSATPTPTPTPTPTTGLKGDVNGDNKVDIIDALMVAQKSAGMNPAGYNANLADVNCSGAVDIIDAMIIAQYGAGLITRLPC